MCEEPTVTDLPLPPIAFIAPGDPVFEKKPKTPHNRRPFTPDEDNQLRALVEKMGENAWHEMENFMPGRSARQCRERWNQYLSPNLDNHPWTPDEDLQLIHFFAVLGPKWSMIAKQFPGRTSNAIKNRIKVHQRRDAREKRGQEDDGSATPMERFHASTVQALNDSNLNIQVDPTYTGYTQDGFLAVLKGEKPETIDQQQNQIYQGLGQ